MKINFKRVEAKSGNVDSIVFFLHGYGADGADLLSIGEVLSEHLPNTLFIAPDAPSKCSMSPVGFQWFPIPWIDGSSEKEASEALETVSKLVDQWMDGIIKSESVEAKNVFLFGFSQGTMLSLHIGPRRSEPLGGLIGCSGRIVNIDYLRRNAKSKFPILLIHGDRDDVVSPIYLDEAVKELESLKFDVKKHISQGVGHGISSDGLTAALDFLVSFQN